MATAIGIGLSPVGWGADPSEPQRLVAAAAVAREHGWSVITSEHAARSDYVPSALALAGVLVGALPGLHVTTAGVLVAARDPLSVLRDADLLASFAEVNGSFELGIVPGHDPTDLPDGRFERRYGAFDAFIDRANGIERSWRLIVGVAGNQRGLERAARADGWIAGTIAATADLPQRIAAYRAAKPDGQISIVRRWLPVDRPDDLATIELPAGVRTDRQELIGGGPEAVAGQLAPLIDAGVDRIVLVPIGTAEQARRLADDLALLSSWETAQRTASEEA